jgi:hypothetical protein
MKNNNTKTMKSIAYRRDDTEEVSCVLDSIRSSEVRGGGRSNSRSTLSWLPVDREIGRIQRVSSAFSKLVVSMEGVLNYEVKA